MSKQQRHSTGRQRTTVSLQATVSGVEVKLDHDSKLAIAYARQWINSGPGRLGLDPLASGVVRRALAVYAQHLNSDGIDPAKEARAVRNCCAGTVPEAAEQEAAFQRLEAHRKAGEGVPMPAFVNVLSGPDRVAKAAAFDEGYGRLLDQLAATGRGRLLKVNE